MIYKRMIAIVAALLMTGCTTKPAWLDENRVACTADGSARGAQEKDLTP